MQYRSILQKLTNKAVIIIPTTSDEILQEMGCTLLWYSSCMSKLEKKGVKIIQNLIKIGGNWMLFPILVFPD